MAAYVKDLKESGRHLSPEKKAMIAEFEADEQLLDQTGMIDFTKNGTIAPQDDGSRLYRPS